MSDKVISKSRAVLNPKYEVLDIAIAAWLDAKSKRSGSTKTAKAYADTLADFRYVLRGSQLDLDGDPRQVALVAQAWAGSSKRNKAVTPATYNQRLAVVSSFYAYANKQGLLTSENPISRVERRPVQGYAKAHGLEMTDLKKAIAQIDRSTAEGKRDFALLLIGLNTGRRLSELAALQRRDLLITGSQILVTWRRCKGGKVMSDKLSVAVSKALIEYLSAVHGKTISSLPENTPIWVSFSRQNRGQAISIQAIADICQKHLGTSRVHDLRHTFAKMMEESGAKVSEIQARLGHESLATTGRYLAALNKAENPYADTLESMLGLKG